MENFEMGRRKRSKLSQILKTFTPISKSRSWPRSADSEEDRSHYRRRRVAPEGCFSVYVGPEKERFMIKTEYANHPLFKLLLEEAEMEYGYNCNEPLALPCEVDLFHKILCEMDSDEIPRGCSFAKGSVGYHLLSPSRAEMN